MNFPIKQPPKYTQKYVLWNENQGKVFLLVGYCPDTLPYFLGLAQELMNDIPDVKPEEITFGKVKDSGWAKGFTLVEASIKGPKRNIPGYSERSWENFDVGY